MGTRRTEEFAVAGDGGTRRARSRSPSPGANGSAGGEGVARADGGAGAGTGVGGGAGAGAGHDRATLAAQWRGTLPWVGIAVVLLLVGVVLAPSRAPDVSPWGQVADVTSRPEPAWTARPSDGSMRTALLTAGTLVSVSTSQVQGIDPDDGELLWSRSLDRPRCTSDGQNLICTEPGSRVLDLAPATGTIADEQTVPEVLLATREADDLYVITGGDTLQLQRLSDGDPVWSTTLEDDIDRGPTRGTDLAVVAGHVLTTLTPANLSPGAAGAVLDAETGNPVGSSEDPANVRRLTAGVWASSTFLTAAIYVRGEPEPHPIEPVAATIGYDEQWNGRDQLRVDDGGDVAVFDTVADSWLWQGGGPSRPVARLDDVLIGMEFEDRPHVKARDAQSGELLWELESTIATCPCVADEHTVVLSTSQVTASDGGFTVNQPQLTAVAARTGETVWQLDSPGAQSRLLTDGEHLIAVDPPQVQVWDLG